MRDILYNYCRFSNIFETEDLCFLTFDPDPLTVPETPPFNLTSYTIVYTPNNSRSNPCTINFSRKFLSKILPPEPSLVKFYLVNDCIGRYGDL